MSQVGITHCRGHSARSPTNTFDIRGRAGAALRCARLRNKFEAPHLRSLPCSSIPFRQSPCPHLSARCVPRSSAANISPAYPYAFVTNIHYHRHFSSTPCTTPPLACRGSGGRSDRGHSRTGIGDHPIHAPTTRGSSLSPAAQRRSGPRVGGDGVIQGNNCPVFAAPYPVAAAPPQPAAAACPAPATTWRPVTSPGIDDQPPLITGAAPKSLRASPNTRPASATTSSSEMPGSIT